MSERRRYPRYPTRWPVCLWLSETCFVTGRVEDVGPYGVRVKFTDSRLLSLMKPGKPFRLQVILGDTEGEFTRVGEVRHVANSGIGLEVKEGLPSTVLTSGMGLEVKEELPLPVPA